MAPVKNSRGPAWLGINIFWGKMSSNVQIVPLTQSRSDMRRFMKFQYQVYRNDPFWVAPLEMDLIKVLTDANPFWRHADGQFWMAVRDGRDVGRIAAVLDRNYVEFQGDATAFFGFFEAIDDSRVSQALFGAACEWARQKGARRLLGPMNPSTNDECGLLIKGFDSSPVLMMPYNPAYYPALIESAGLEKAKDLLAYYIDLINTPMQRFERVASKFKQRQSGISVRPILRKTIQSDIQKIKAIYNQAWERNWGFVPLTEAEVDFMAERLGFLLTEGISYLAETPQGEAVGFLLALPDYNQVFKAMKGRLVSWGTIKALPYLLHWKVVPTCRVITLGVKADYRGRGIEAAMLADGLREGFKLGFKNVEASWILEDNVPVQRIIALFGGEPYKVYRVYQKAL